MAKINGLIPEQNFEKIRDRIGQILAIEIANQYTISGDAQYNPTIWVERTTPFDKTELPAINVRLNSIDFDNEDVRSSDANTSWYIDCYTNSEYSDDGDGDKLAMVNLQRILGIVRAILKNPQYKTLDFAPPFLCTTKISRLFIGEVNTSDALSSVVGRIEFSVRVPENVQLLDVVPLMSAYTTVYMGETDKGYRWEFVEGDIDIFILENGDYFISEVGSNFFIKN